MVTADPGKKATSPIFFPTVATAANGTRQATPQGLFAGSAFTARLWVDPQREVVISKVSAQQEPVHDDTDHLLVRAFGTIAEAVS